MSEFIRVDDIERSFQELWNSTDSEISFGNLYHDNQDNLENLAKFIAISSYRDVDLIYSEICTFKGYIDLFENVGFHIFNDISPREQKYFYDRLVFSNDADLFIHFLFYQIEE